MRFDVDAILFDIDGTLVDSTRVVERSWRAWSARRSVDAEEVLRVCHGRRTEDTVALFLPEADWAAGTLELEQLELDDLDVVAVPGADALLRQLPPGRWAAVTSGSQRLMRARLQAAGLPVPDVLVAAEDVDRGKPDPQGYRAAASALGVDIRRCLVIEDAPAGLLAGGAAGAHTIAVTTSHAASELAPADVIAADLTGIELGITSDRLIVTVAR